MSHKQALLLLALTATMWSIGGWLIKSVNLPPMSIACARSFVAAIVMWGAIRRPKFIWTKAQWTAAFSLALTVLAFVASTRMTTAANSILLQYTAPVYVALLSAPLLGEKITKRDWLTLAIVIGGMVLFFIEQVSVEHFWGNLIALGSGVTFAGIAVALRMQKGQSTVESILLGHIICVILGLPFLFMGPMPTAHDLGIITTLGVFQLGIPYVFYGIAIRHVSALEGILIPVLEPLFNPIWVAIFIGEKPSPLAIVGGVIVITAVVTRSISKMPKREQPHEVV